MRIHIRCDKVCAMRSIHWVNYYREDASLDIRATTTGDTYIVHHPGYLEVFEPGQPRKCVKRETPYHNPYFPEMNERFTPERWGK